MADQAFENNEDVPIAVVNGPDPLVLLAAAMSFNEPIDELRVASALHERLYGAKLGLVELPNGVQVPADLNMPWRQGLPRNWMMRAHM